jgi:hypothetical protein
MSKKKMMRQLRRKRYEGETIVFVCDAVTERSLAASRSSATVINHLDEVSTQGPGQVVKLHPDLSMSNGLNYSQGDGSQLSCLLRFAHLRPC